MREKNKTRSECGLAGPFNSLSYQDAAELIERYGRGAIWIRHCFAVSRVAGRCAEIFSAKYDVDIGFVRTAALLHDIGRYKTHDPIMHGVEGYRLLTGLGHHREAFVCASHVLSGLRRKEAVVYGLPERDFIPASLEERLIPVADSLVEFDRPTDIQSRLSSIRRRYEGNDFFLRKAEAAAIKTREFIDAMNEEFGISMEKIAEETLPD